MEIDIKLILRILRNRITLQDRYLGADLLTHAIDEEKSEDVHRWPEDRLNEIQRSPVDVILDEQCIEDFLQT